MLVLFAMDDKMETQSTRKKMHAVRIHDYGKTDVLKYEEVDMPDLDPGVKDLGRIAAER
jgi:hypothetical protein